MNKSFLLTKQGVTELEQELAGLVAQRGPVADSIKTAREFGDLAENAEYQSARQEQERLEMRIAEIEHILQNVDIIKKPKGDNQVQLGSVIQLKSEKSGKTKQFQVVGTVEADPLNGKISDDSPVGRALLGKRVGDEVPISLPTDQTTYRITEIS